MMTKKEDVVQKFQTACGSCIFAQYGHWGVQIDCQLDRLSKFKKQNRAVLDKNDKVESYIIEGICNTCRGKQWAEANKGANLITAALKEAEVKIDIVLYSIDDIVDNLDWKIGQAVNACAKQHKIKPTSIIVVVKNNETSFTSIYNTIQDIVSQYDIPFQLVRVMEDDADVGRAIEMGINKCHRQYVATFDVDHSIPSNFIERFNELVNEEMKRVLLLEPIISYNCMVITRVLFDMLGKNYNIPIFEKIKEVAVNQHKENLILPWSQLWSRE